MEKASCSACGSELPLDRLFADGEGWLCFRCRHAQPKPEAAPDPDVERIRQGLLELERLPARRTRPDADDEPES